MSDFPVPEPVPELPAESAPDALDIQHDSDPAHDHGSTHRIPNLGHALSFFSLAFLCLQFSLTGVFAAAHIPADAMLQHPGLGLLSEAIAWIATLLAASWLFSRLWKLPFLQGIHWNPLAAKRRWYWILPAAIALSLVVSYAERFVKSPDNDLVGKLMSTQRGAWLVTLFGVVLAPLVEEIAFRGFLMPALATMYDWLALDRTPAGLRRWETSTLHTTASLVFGAVFASIPFALLHAGQLHGAWGAVGLLFAVSLALSFARAKTHSVACSALMHSVYNLTGFVAIFISTGGYRHLDKL